MIKNLVFDFNDVVIWNKEKNLLKEGAKKLKKSFLLTVIRFFLIHYQHQVGKINSKQHWSYVFGLKEKELEKKYNELIVKPYEKNEENKNVTKELKKLKGKFKLFLLSNSCEEQTKINKKLNRYKYFNEIFLSEQLGVMKPDPRFWIKMIKKTKIKPKESIYIDDLIHNVFIAKLLGFKTIWYRKKTDFKKELKKFRIN